MGGSHVTCQFLNLLMSHVPVAYFSPYCMSNLRKANVACCYIFNLMLHVTKHYVTESNSKNHYVGPLILEVDSPSNSTATPGVFDLCYCSYIYSYLTDLSSVVNTPLLYIFKPAS